MINYSVYVYIYIYHCIAICAMIACRAPYEFIACTLVRICGMYDKIYIIPISMAIVIIVKSRFVDTAVNNYNLFNYTYIITLYIYCTCIIYIYVSEGYEHLLIESLFLNYHRQLFNHISHCIPNAYIMQYMHVRHFKIHL